MRESTSFLKVIKMSRCKCNFDNTGGTHDYDCPLHPDRNQVRMVKVEYIEGFQAENEKLSERIHRLEEENSRYFERIEKLKNSIEFALSFIKIYTEENEHGTRDITIERLEEDLKGE